MASLSLNSLPVPPPPPQHRSLSELAPIRRDLRPIVVKGNPRPSCRLPVEESSLD
ncbi:hypothetical protein QJS10_CPB21g01425 [Acorus calamus]|uniref:Uncharacterized protein n=1 Tax=Acorus calamus TaxID=4465 RepID=A0AAV9C3D2_ACOCL|nr:hypothetical protein QJS10_CPB21g01425 [Acorus calamus]